MDLARCLGPLTISKHGLISSVRSTLSSKLRGPGFKSWLDSVNGLVTIIMWGGQPGLKLALSYILLPRVNMGHFLWHKIMREIAILSKRGPLPHC